MDIDHVLHRDWMRIPPMVDRGEGVYLYDAQGRRYLDGSGGPMVVNIGHGVPEIIDAMVAQARKVSFPYSGHFLSESQVRLSERIIEFAPPGMARVYFVSGGSEATEVAIKLVRRYHLERGEPARVKIISRWQGYHGATIGALSLSGHTQRRTDYLPYLMDVPHIAPAYCYRCPFDAAYPSCGLRCAHELERAIIREGAGSVAAFIAEPIVSGTLGCAVPPPEYFPIIRDICDRYGLLLIDDEVVTGFGRTGKNFGLDHWGVSPDLIVTGKGISSGYTALGAVILRQRVFDAFLASSRPSIFLGYTYSGNPLSSAIGLAVLDYVMRHSLVDRAAAMGSYLRGRLDRLAAFPIVGDIRGKGLLWGIELVSDREKKTPFDRSLKVAETVARRTFEKGVIVYPGAGTADGATGDHIILSPPFIIEKGQVDDLVCGVEEALTETAERLPRG